MGQTRMTTMRMRQPLADPETSLPSRHSQMPFPIHHHHITKDPLQTPTSLLTRVHRHTLALPIPVVPTPALTHLSMQTTMQPSEQVSPLSSLARLLLGDYLSGRAILVRP